MSSRWAGRVPVRGSSVLAEENATDVEAPLGAPHRPTAGQRSLLVLTAAGSAMLTAWVTNTSTDASLLACVLTFWLVLAVNARSLGAVAFSFGVLSLYATGPWLASAAGQRYPPFYQHAVLLDTSRSTMATVTAALGLVAVVLTFTRTRTATDVWRAIATAPPQPRMAVVQFLGFVAWGLALRDFVVLAPDIGAVLNSPRRAFADSLWVTSSTNVQILYLCLAAVATIAWPRLERGLRWLVLPPLLAAVVMQLIIGSRKEILLGLVVVLPVLWLRQSRRGLLAAGASVLVGGALALPALRDADTALVPTEIALPGYTSVAALHGQISQSDITYNFWDGALALLPSQLRLVNVNIDIGADFAQYGFQSVGIGATPWLEAGLGFPGSPLVAATLIVAALHLLWRLSLDRVPILAVTGWPFLILLGRSTFWIVVFGGVYLTLLTCLSVHDNQTRRARWAGPPRAATGSLSYAATVPGARFSTSSLEHQPLTAADDRPTRSPIAPS
jgi:hypothetical protein